MTELVERESEEGEDGAHSPNSETAAARLRERGERVRRRELDAAVGRLEARGEVSTAERAILARLAARITAAVVEPWVSTLADGEADPETALELLTDS